MNTRFKNTWVSLKEAITEIERENGGPTAASKNLGISRVYLWHLKRYSKVNPSEKTLKKLGLRKGTMYSRIKLEQEHD